MIAIALGAVLSRFRLTLWPITTLLMLWPSFGGHWVEIWFLNCLRPRLSVARGVQIAARIGVWFLGGVGLAIGMELTAMALPGFKEVGWQLWWMAGFAFIGIELIAHLALQLRGRPSFYNAQG